LCTERQELDWADGDLCNTKLTHQP